MFAACCVSLVFGHIMDRFGQRMYRTMESIEKFEAEHAPQALDEPEIREVWKGVAGKREFDLAAWVRNGATKLTSVKAHEAVKWGFFASGALALIAALFFSKWLIISCLACIAVIFGIIGAFATIAETSNRWLLVRSEDPT